MMDIAPFNLEEELIPFDPVRARSLPNPLTVLNPSGDAFKRYRIITLHGGRGSGKTFGVASSITHVMSMTRLKVLCGRELQISIADSSKAEIELAIERSNADSSFRITKSYIQHRKTKSVSIFKGLKSNIDSLKSIAGIKLVWVEEGQSSTKETLEKLLPSIRTPGNRIILSMNPEDENAFVYQEMIAKAGNVGYEDRLAVQVNYHTNPYFTESLESDRINALQRILDAPNEEARNQAIADYAWIWLGQTKRVVGNAVLKRWEEREFEAPPDHQVEFLYGADWSNGGADPTAGVRCFIANNERDKPCLWVDYDLRTNNSSLDDLPELFVNSLPGLVSSHYGIPQPTMRADSSLPLAINKMNDSGIWTEAAKKPPNSVQMGITFLNNFDRIYVHPRCVDTIEEFKLYRWRVDRITGKIQPTFEKGNDHIPDAIRYALEHMIIENPESFFSFMNEQTQWKWSVIGKQFMPKSGDAPNTNGFKGTFGFY